MNPKPLLVYHYLYIKRSTSCSSPSGQRHKQLSERPLLRWHFVAWLRLRDILCICISSVAPPPTNSHFYQNVDGQRRRVSCAVCCVPAGLIVFAQPVWSRGFQQYCTLPLNIWADAATLPVNPLHTHTHTHRPRRGTISAQFGNTMYCTIIFYKIDDLSPSKSTAEAGDFHLRRKRIIYEHIQHLIYSSRIIRGV